MGGRPARNGVRPRGGGLVYDAADGRELLLDALRHEAGVREQLAIATAEYNGCEYCLSAHTYIGASIAKVEPLELEKARSGHSDDKHTEALLTLSGTIARGRGQVSESALATARAAGVTDAEIGEVVGHLALNVLTNYFNILAGVEDDWPVVTPA